MNRYQLCNQQAEIEKAKKREAAKQYRDRFRDPFMFLDEDETPYTKQGSIAIEKAMEHLRAFWTGHRHTERTAILVMYYVALLSSSKVIYLEEVQAEPVVSIPRIEIAKHPRHCAVCATKTSSGIRALCDGCHTRFVIDKNYRNTPLTFEEVNAAIWRSDTRHRAAVQARLAS
jgi:hypothetical protein